MFKRKLLCILTAATLLLSLAPAAPAFADSGGGTESRYEESEIGAAANEFETVAEEFKQNSAEFQTLAASGGFLAPIGAADPSATVIRTAQDLYDVRNNLSGSYVLGNDIDLSGFNGGQWTPIDDPSPFGDARFAGIFDGRGHVIRNLTITNNEYESNGLFARIQGGTVKNVGLENVNINIESDSSVYAGGICGYADSDSVISNCYNTGIISASPTDGDAYVGGIAGLAHAFTYTYNYSDDGPVDISNCYNTGIISASPVNGGAFVGGLVGRIYVQASDNDVFVDISGCYNTGNVTAFSTAVDADAGGIIGYVYGYDGSVDISDCHNTGNISSFSYDSVAEAGGIAGFVAPIGDGSVNINNCYNTGDISASSDDGVDNFSCAGGIAGQVNNWGDSVVINNCHNTGNVYAFSDNTTVAYAGGVVGDASGPIVSTNANNCYNAGAVFAATYGDSYAGGIYGAVHNTLSDDDGYSINSCHNTGDISASSIGTGEADAGGIYGFGEGIIVSDCYNTGKITASSGAFANAGGICGRNYGLGSFHGGDGDDIEVNGCYNTGAVFASVSADVGIPDIETEARAGGIVGDALAIDGSIDISACYNVGHVSASGDGDNVDARAGGVAGAVWADDCDISDCYNTGYVSASVSGECVASAGGICGIGDDTDAADSDINRCYNAGDISAASPWHIAIAGGISGSPEDIKACFALSRSITAEGATRIVALTTPGRGLDGNNYALEGPAGDFSGLPTGISRAQATSQSVYEGAGWDFVNMWKMPDLSDSFPELRWQSGDFPSPPPPEDGAKEDISTQITLTDGNFTYDGNAKALAASGFDDGGAYAYSYTGTGGTVYGPAEAAPVNAGTYRVTATYTSEYSFGSKSALLTIGKLAPAVSNISFSLSPVTYDGYPHPVSVTAGAGKTGLGIVTVKYNGSATAPTDAGSCAVTADIAAGTNYGAVTGLPLGSLIVNKASAAGIDQTLYVKANAAEDYVLDLKALLPGTVPAAQVSAYTVTNVTSGGAVFTADGAKISGTTLTVHMGSEAAANSAEAITIGFTSGNYDITSAVIIVNITDKTLVGISAPAASAKVYDKKALDVSAVAASPETALDLSYSGTAYDGTVYTGSAEAPVKAGNYVLTARVSDDDEYIGVAKFGFEIKKAPITLTADDKSITVGAALPAYTYSLSGLVSPDAKADVMGGEPALSCPGANAGVAGRYVITADGGTLNAAAGANYRIAARVNGSLTVSASSPQSSGGSGGSTPSSAPLTAADGSVSISYTTAGDNLTLSLPDDKISEIIKGSKDTAVFDATGVTGATTVSMAKSALAKIAEAVPNIEVKLPAGTVGADKTALSSVLTAARGADVSFGIERVGTQTLTESQRTRLGQGDSVFDINISSESQSITTFDGVIAITVSYAGALPAGAWSLTDAGKGDKLTSVYLAASSELRFELPGHLSLYAVGPDTGASAWANPFTDVSASDWFYGDVEYAVTNNLFTGTSANAFSPNATMTRAMLVTVLGRLANADAGVYAASGFDDVAAGQYYTAYVAWAKENGIVNGTGDDKFSPNAEITRQDLATLLLRYSEFSGKQFPVTLQYARFSDEARISDYAKAAVETLYRGGIVSGKPGNVFDPGGSATRAETAAVLHRFAEAAK